MAQIGGKVKIIFSVLVLSAVMFMFASPINATNHHDGAAYNVPTITKGATGTLGGSTGGAGPQGGGSSTTTESQGGGAGELPIVVQ